MQQFGRGLLVLTLATLMATPALAQRARTPQQGPGGSQPGQTPTDGQQPEPEQAPPADRQPDQTPPEGRQRGQAPPAPPTMSMPDLLQIEAVQQDLKLTAQQIERVQAVAEQLRTSMRSMMGDAGGFGGPGGQRGQADPGGQRGQGGAGDAPGAGPGGRPGGAPGAGPGGFGGGGFNPEQFTEMRAAREKLNQQATAVLAKVLTADQRNRANQILVQTQGNAAFSDPKVVEKLKLTDEQQEQISTIIEGSREELRSTMQRGQAGEEGGRPDFQAMASRRQEVEKATKENILAVLTDEQRSTWNEHIGTPIELPAGGFGFGGRGPGGPGGIGGPGGRGQGGPGGAGGAGGRGQGGPGGAGGRGEGGRGPGGTGGNPID